MGAIFLVKFWLNCFGILKKIECEGLFVSNHIESILKKHYIFV
jgi:hypothetical protein